MSSEALAVATAPADEVVLKVRGLSKCYAIYDEPKDRLKQQMLSPLRRLAGLTTRDYHREFWALRDVSFDVRRGETVGIVGKNGSGKSTLLHLIVGTHEPTAGTVEVAGRITALLELGSGFNPLFTGRENVYLNAAILGMDRAETDSRFDEIAAFADIGAFMDQPVNTYSSGMYVRLAFAVQVCLEPDILVVDEALAVGDAYFVHRCFNRIRRMKEQGRTILFVSHDTGSVNNLCDRALWLHDGRLRGEGPPDQITAQYRADLFALPWKPAEAQAQPVVAETSPATGTREAAEAHVPNVDRRMGGRETEILGVALYDAASRRPVADARPDQELRLRISCANRSLAPGVPLIMGFVVTSARGEELFGVNSRMLEATTPAPAVGAVTTVSIRFRLPNLHRGHYAITVAVATAAEGGAVVIHDRIENALVFHMGNDAEVVGLMRIPATIVTEEAAE
jgi:lipopolysaccharide transport system ATP-binding protein